MPKIDLNARIGHDLRGVFWLEQNLLSFQQAVGPGQVPRRGVRRQRSYDEWAECIPHVPNHDDISGDRVSPGIDEDSGDMLSSDIFGMSSEGEAEVTSGDGLSIDDANVESPPRQSGIKTSVSLIKGSSRKKKGRSGTIMPASPVYHITVNLTVNSPTPTKEGYEDSYVTARIEEAVRRAVSSVQEEERE